MIEEAAKKISEGKDLEAGAMRLVMEEILSGRAPTPQIVRFLSALSKKGETAEELTAAVSVMRRHATQIKTKQKLVLDTCGTGGDKKGTFNISTAVAFVASGAGITVAKHGNRSVSSACGSADILEASGININMDVKKIEQCLDDIGIAFLFAQSLHPAMKYAMPARKEIGARTIFNLLGPLSNPAGATHQLVGVYDRRWTEVLAEVLGNLGAVHAMVVYGEDGLDEITTVAKTHIAETHKGKVSTYTIEPGDFGLDKAEPAELSGGNAAYNAGILMDILTGKTGPRRDIILLNAAAAIYVADRAGSIKEGLILAKESLDTKKALEKFELLKEYSHK